MAGNQLDKIYLDELTRHAVSCTTDFQPTLPVGNSLLILHLEMFDPEHVRKRQYPIV